MRAYGEYLASHPAGEGRAFYRLVVNGNQAWLWGRLIPLDADEAEPVFLRGRRRSGETQVLGAMSRQGSRWRMGSLPIALAEREHAYKRLESVIQPAGEDRPIFEKGDFVAEQSGDLVIRPSALDGLGLHTRGAIRAGAVITPIQGLKTAKQSRFSVRLTEDLHCEPSGYIRFVNHACNANAEIDASNPKRPVLRALRNIKPGEEIGFDYIANEGEIVGGFTCNCGAPNHRF